MTLHVAVIEQQPDAPAGIFGEWAVARGVRVTTLRPDDLLDPPAPTRFDAIVPLGSEQSVCAPTAPWVDVEVAYLGAAVAADVAVLGICFGGQALARALGGEVHPLPEPEHGWLTYASDDPLHRGPWLAWHRDAFTVPPGAELLAHSPVCPHAFRHGRHVGLQYHCEATPAILEAWIAGPRGSLYERPVDAEMLRAAAIAAIEDGAPARAFALFDQIAGRWSKAP